MSTNDNTPPEAARGPGTDRLFRILNTIERIGNLLPHPFYLFIILSVVLAIISLLAGGAAVPGIDGSEGTTVRNLISREGATFALTSAIENFITFPALGLILVMFLGVSLADKSGLFSALLRGAVLRSPTSLITLSIFVIGITASVASDAAYFVLIPIAAAVFKMLGRSPILGVVVGYTAVSAGYDASLLIGPADVILSGLTTAAAQTVEPDAYVSPVANYYFSATSVVFLAIAGWLVVEYVLQPRLKSMEAFAGSPSPDDPTSPESSSATESAGNASAVSPGIAEDTAESLTLSTEETRGLRNAAILTVLYWLFWAIVLLPEGSFLRGEGGSIVESPFLDSIVVIIAGFFFLAGIAYGVGATTIERPGQVPEMMAKGVAEISNVVVLFFVISQFLGYFEWTRIGEWIAVNGAVFLRSTGLGEVPLLFGALILICLLALSITSGSGLWALVAPILVPMLMLVEIRPEVTLALYRIGDSVTNVISPMSPYFAIALGFIQRYDKRAGIGTLLSMTLPVAVAMLVVWSITFFIWVILDIPFGPGY